jgi:hypothetical protein
MLSPIGLTPIEIREVTGFSRATKQCEALALMKIPFMVRPNGTPFVASADISNFETPSKSTKDPILNLI